MLQPWINCSLIFFVIHHFCSIDVFISRYSPLKNVEKRSFSINWPNMQGMPIVFRYVLRRSRNYKYEIPGQPRIHQWLPITVLIHHKKNIFEQKANSKNRGQKQLNLYSVTQRLMERCKLCKDFSYENTLALFEYVMEGD